MAQGGKRDGAGRKRGEPTRQIRIPARAADATREVMEYLLARAQEELEKTVWWKSCPPEARDGIEVWLDGLDEIENTSFLGTRTGTKRTVLVAEAFDPEVDETQRVFLEL